MNVSGSIYLSMHPDRLYSGTVDALLRKGSESMRLQLTSHRIDLSEDLKDFVERRIHFALGRFTGRIKALSVRLTDVNGPRKGMDKCCAIRVNAGYGGPLVVRERQDNIYSAVALAVERAERAVQRQLSLGRTAGKGPANSRVSFQFGD